MNKYKARINDSLGNEIKTIDVEFSNPVDLKHEVNIDGTRYKVFVIRHELNGPSYIECDKM